MARASRINGLRRTNDPPLLILTSLVAGPKHGHALAKDVATFAGVDRRTLRRDHAIGRAGTH
jgi:hypothetical protein